MPTDVGIWNIGLRHLGVETISGFSDGTVQADSGNALYAIVRDALLESADWHFAYEWGKALTVSASTPTTDWEYQFTLPSDLRTLKRVHDQGYEIEYLLVETQLIYVNQNTSVYVDYIRDADESVFSNLFVRALAYECAVACCMELTGDRTLLQLMQQEAAKYTAIAKAREAYQQAPQKLGQHALSR